ncbi:MAG: hypothetical protein ACYDG2_25825, partial [Ruminiclostridium sp.]
MGIKKAVQFKKQKHTRFAYQKLNYCLKCNTYTAFQEDTCLECGSNRLQSIDKHVDVITKRRFQIDQIFILILLFLGIIFSRNLMDLGLITFFSVLVLIFINLLQRKNFVTERANNLLSLVKNQSEHIREGLDKNANIASDNIKAQNFKIAYEQLRDLSTLLIDDGKKIQKLICLDQFILRKDMELEADSLIISEYSIGLVYYIFEIAKVNRNLIKKKTIDYIIQYEGEILKLDIGHEILASVAGATLRTKQHVMSY